MHAKLIVGLMLGIFLGGSALADPKPGSNEAVIKKALLTKFSGAHVQNIQKTPYDGLYEVLMDGQLLYTDAKVNYLFAGNLIDAKTQRNLTAARMRDLMQVKFDTLPLDLAIKQVKGDGKRKMAVFSDPDCPYCKKLDADLVNVNNVTIYTFLYPIASLHPDADSHAKAIWCAPDRARAWDDLMRSGTLPQTGTDCATPLAKIAELGSQLRINGTPTIIFADGLRVPGAVPVAQLEKLLNGERTR